MQQVTCVFQLSDQMRFAELSGDYNPIHIDPIAARRLLFGRPVVHGVHTLLWALDCWLAEHLAAVEILNLSCSFHSALRLGDTVSATSETVSQNEVKLKVTSVDATLLTASLRWRTLSKDASNDTVVADASPTVEGPAALTLADVPSARGSIPLQFSRSLAREMFSYASSRLPVTQFATILGSTRVVGMRVPGLHSMFYSMALQQSDGQAQMHIDGQLRYTVERFDKRFSRAVIELNGGALTGKAVAFLRPTPVAQLSFADIRDAIIPDEFSGERALIIGGSRGLGEIAVKQLAAGGADVQFSFHSGEADSRRLRDEIRGGGGHAECFQFNAASPSPDFESACKKFAPTLLCFFATPPIGGSNRGQFSIQLFRSLSDFYIGSFMEVVRAAEAGGSLRYVLNPSTVAIQEAPLGMGEYAAAKAAAEVLVAVMAKTYGHLYFHMPRWGRMPTDLTASLVAADACDPVPVVLNALRAAMAGKKIGVVTK